MAKATGRPTGRPRAAIQTEQIAFRLPRICSRVWTPNGGPIVEPQSLFPILRAVDPSTASSDLYRRVQDWFGAASIFTG